MANFLLKNPLIAQNQLILYSNLKKKIPAESFSETDVRSGKNIFCSSKDSGDISQKR